jgi:small subunit ribosomal protein S19
MAEKQKVTIKSKELKYRGKTLEELQKLDVRESAKYLPSRARRYILRNFEVIEKFLKKVEKKSLKKKKIKTQTREIVIVPKLVGSTIYLHNGKSFSEILITMEMIGHRLGEFAQTRNKVNHGSAGIGATKSSRAQKK